MAGVAELRQAEVAGSAPVVGRAIIMKRVPYSGLAFLILALLSMPAWAQARSHSNAAVHTGFSRARFSRGRFSRHATVSRHAKSNDRSNKGGRVRGREPERAPVEVPVEVIGLGTPKEASPTATGTTPTGASRHVPG